MHDANERAPRNHTKAATKDVLGFLSKPTKINPKWKSHYDRLSELRDRFIDQRGNLVKDASEETPNFSEHMADAGTDSYDRDFTLSLLSSEQSALYEIDAALKRIENGTYGVCEVTGEEIEAGAAGRHPLGSLFHGCRTRPGATRGGRPGSAWRLGSVTSSGDSSTEEAETEEEGA